MNIVVIGLGYVGLVTAVCLADKGNNVIGADVDRNKIKMLKNDEMPFYEPMLENMIKKNKKRLNFEFINNKIYNDADVFFITVGTPEKKDGSANLQYVYEAVYGIIKNITKDTTIVIKSTVPVGTNNKIKNLIKDNLKKFTINVVSNPEFLSQGTAIQDEINPQRIIIGTDSKQAIKIIKDIYKQENEKYILTDSNTAELIKYASNSFLALKISYINEISNLCEKLNANIEDVEKGMKMDKRIGKYFLNAGIGYGGSCFPKDTKALEYMAKSMDNEIQTITATINVNKKQVTRILDKARKYYSNFDGLNIAILGMTYKPDTDDIRESPAVSNLNKLLEYKTTINVYNPVPIKKLNDIYQDRIKFVNNLSETLKNSDLCFIFTEWKQIKEMDLKLFERYMRKPIILDGRNCFKLSEIKKYNVIYESMGRRTINNLN